MAYFHIITCAHIYKIIKNNKILFYQLFAIKYYSNNFFITFFIIELRNWQICLKKLYIYYQ
jgi:hypothetical protein